MRRVIFNEYPSFAWNYVSAHILDNDLALWPSGHIHMPRIDPAGVVEPRVWPDGVEAEIRRTTRSGQLHR